MTLPEFQLTHVALVGARMAMFRELGFQDRNELATCRVVPEPGDQALEAMSEAECRTELAAQLPIWVHNIISDPEFPNREKLLMPLRRFEGELSDSRTDEVVASVLSAGFRNRTLDPLNLPSLMPLRQRCAILMHIGVWQEAYKSLERDLVELLCANAADLSSWKEFSREAENATID